MVKLGVRVEFWQPVLKAAFLKRLRREPTPAEYELQQEQLGLLVSQLVTHIEIDEDGTWTPLASEEDDYKLVRISGYDVIDLNKTPLEMPEALQGMILCVEGFCFVPKLFSLRSELILQEKDFVLFQGHRSGGAPKGRRRKTIVTCAVFRERNRGPVVVTLPLPRIRHETIRMLQVKTAKGVVKIHIKSLTQAHFAEG